MRAKRPLGAVRPGDMHLFGHASILDDMAIYVCVSASRSTDTHMSLFQGEVEIESHSASPLLPSACTELWRAE